MTDRTLTAMYDTRGAAETARDQLVGLGVARDAIAIHGTEGGETAHLRLRRPRIRAFGPASPISSCRTRIATPTPRVSSAAAICSARACPTSSQEAAAEILEGSDPIDLDQRSASLAARWLDRLRAGGIRRRTARAAYGEGAGLAEAGARLRKRDDHGTARQGYGEVLVRSQRPSAGIRPPVPATR